MYVKRDWIAPSSRLTASKSPKRVRERFTTASSDGRVASMRAVALAIVPSPPIRKQISRVWCGAGRPSNGWRLAVQ